MPPPRHRSERSPQPWHWGLQVFFAQQRRSIQVGPEVLAAKRGFPPDTDAPRDGCNAEQTSAAPLDPGQP